jgi:predicted DNA-binding transcriptional regulator YafY
MSRAARLLELLELLRKRRTPASADDLATKLGVSVRTLYRDIATLQEQGAKIRGEPGIGYVLRPGFTLPPLMFSAEELEALMLGSRWVAQRGDADLVAAAQSAVEKIRAVLPQELRESMEEATLTVPTFDSGMPTQVDLAVIRSAIRGERKVTIEYRTGSGATTRRTIWPIVIGYFEKVLLLVGWCESRGDFRSFRVDRIGALEETGRPYPQRRVVLVREWRKIQGIDTADRN